ncbi:MAG: hypothetical protein M5Z89_02020, partial [Olivibacter sp.]|nr:hypothetical protein [Olivibacter sp. UJ_SKK_5.1]
MAKLNLPIHDAINKLKSEISLFLEDNRGFFLNQGKQLSSYFEMACYNHIVSYYKNSGWMIEIQNLQSDYFRYKLSTAGYPENFSYFQIYKEVNVGNNRRILVFEIHHNLCIQSFHNEDIYLVPDISVINFKSIVNDENHYLKGFNKKFSYVRNKDLQ